MKFGKIFDCTRTEEAKQYIGKRGVFSNFLRDIIKWPEEKCFGTLVDVVYNDAYPFMWQDEDGRRAPFQFFRPILEQEKGDRI